MQQSLPQSFSASSAHERGAHGTGGANLRHSVIASFRPDLITGTRATVAFRGAGLGARRPGLTKG